MVFRFTEWMPNEMIIAWTVGLMVLVAFIIAVAWIIWGKDA